MDLLLEGEWLTDQDILCWLNQELYNMEIDVPCVWTIVVRYNRLTDCQCGCKPLNLPLHWTTWFGAIATFSWSPPMTNDKGHISSSMNSC